MFQFCFYYFNIIFKWSGKKSKSVFDFLTYSRETGFSFSYEEVEHLHRANGPSNEIDRVSKFNNSLSFGAKQNALRQIFFALWFFQYFFYENCKLNFFRFFMILCRINKGVYFVCLSMQIRKRCLSAYYLGKKYIYTWDTIWFRDLIFN